MGKNLKLWYKSPAENWNEALPVGNGRLGAMIYGGVFQEKLQMNEESVWYGGKRDRNNPDALKYLPEIREHILSGRLDEAHELATFALSGIPDSQRNYQSLGDVLMGFKHKSDSVSEYKRELDLENASVNVSYRIDGINFNRKIFCSNPDNVLVVKITADKKKSIDLTCLLRRGRYLDNPSAQKSDAFCLYAKEKYFDSVEKTADNQLMLTGDCGKDGVDFCFSIKAEAKGGRTFVIGEHLIVREADEVTLYISSATTFNHKEYKQACLDVINKACLKGADKLFESHVKDYTAIFDRVDISLENKDERDFSNLPTDERLLKAKENGDNRFVALYFQFCRYLMISSSREGTLPANLQGIWCDEYSPEWDSKFTININTEMNYWPVEAANLSECHQPLFKLLERLVENGRVTARKMYGCSGFVAHHNTDIWADTAPQDIVTGSSYWVFGGAWLALHIYEHYQFTLDKDFLKKYYYVLKEASEFFLDYLIEDENGVMMTCPSSSPENIFITNGKKYSLTTSCTMDFEILRNLFNAAVKSAEALNIDGEFQARLKECAEKFPERKIGSYGQLLEWQKEYEEIDLGHRHFSHLFSLCPGNLIDAELTPDLAEACRKSIEYRLSHGSAHTGWSRAWVINFFCRLRDGENAYHHLMELFSYSTIKNLFNSHPPFQIDGNFGSLSAICEMFLQSQNKLLLLPALPKQFKTGCVKGLKARGNITVDLFFEEHKLKTASFISPIAQNIEFWYDGREYKAELNKNEQYEITF